ncbi:metallophosphoesterase [Metabacillus fastidiosus]|uniref:metallophosphoesterase n=1 Tax=Metabacillus fastidiosus TaxID=1458 RepID=UPI003D2C10A9
MRAIMCLIIFSTAMIFTASITNAEISEKAMHLNIKNNEILSGKVMIKATSNHSKSPLRIEINGEEQKNLYKALEDDAQLVFEVKGTNLFFKNGVTIGTKVLKTFDDTVKSYKTISVPVPANELKIGANNKISIRSGTKVSPFDDSPEENRDDFSIKNIRLILSDGTVIRDSTYDLRKEIVLGDKTQAYHFQFDLKEENFRSVMKEWDTKKMRDGSYEIKVIADSHEEIKSNITVDNTAPEIIPTIEEGKEYKGEIKLEASVKDELSDVKKITAKVDNTSVSLPYVTSSAYLSPGEHVFKIAAEDRAGNKRTVKRTFSVVEEAPLLPTSKSGNVSLNHAKLSVKVTDPTDDYLDVSFYKAYKYTSQNKESMKIFKNESETEPPKTFRPEGEQSFRKSEYKKVAAANSKTVETKSMTKFPYHRFDVTVDTAVKEDDDVEFIWKGYSLPNRKVTMYAWSYREGRWLEVDSKIAGKEPFTLTGKVNAGDFVKDRKISVIVQDELAKERKKYDYSFVWMTDTQYYSQSYPHIFKSITDWIVQNEKKLNIEYVFHTGDIVDKANDEKQWANAAQYMKELEKANVPYGILAGNHDVHHKYADYKDYSKYFGESRFEKKSFYGGSYKNNKGHYDLISVKGNDYLMLYMGWGIGEEEIKWMNEVLAKYPDRIAILSFHEYLLVSGNRSPLGNKLFEEVVVPNKNVALVLCGHYHDSETLVDEIDDDGDGKSDRKVYQMLADYQGAPEGGQGFIRLLRVDVSSNKIDVRTYSPYLKRYNYYDFAYFPGKDEFSLELDLEPREKMVATDYFETNIYTDTLVGQVNDVKSGNTASVIWNGLVPAKTYYWYTIVEDKFNGKKRSPIWGFTIVDGRVKAVSDGRELGEEKISYPLKSEEPLRTVVHSSFLLAIIIIIKLKRNNNIKMRMS